METGGLRVTVLPVSSVALVFALGLSTLLCARPAEAQDRPPYRIGWLDPSPADFPDWRQTFLAELKKRADAPTLEYSLEWQENTAGRELTGHLQVAKEAIAA